MNQNYNKSIFYILGLILTTVVITVMSISLTYNYFYTKTEITDSLNKNAKLTLLRLKNSISPFIESYSINEYEKLIINEMGDINIFAIIVEDYLSGEIFGDKVLYNGKIRDDSFDMELYDNKSKVHNKLLEKSYLTLSSNIFSGNKSKIGKVNIYYTNKHINKKLETLVKKSFFIILAVSLILIFFLFFSIKNNILNPIERIVQTLLDKDKDGLPLKIIPSEGPKEIQALSRIMNEIISTTRSSKEKIVELNERFELTLDAVQDGIWDWDVPSDKTYFSKRWKSMLGYEDIEIENTGSSFFNLIHDGDKEKINEAMILHFKNPNKYDYNLEVRLRCKNGTYKWVQSRGKVILDYNGNPKRMLGYHSDISEQKRNEAFQKHQEEVLTEQSKLASMGEMIGNIAHQWRQPLSVISTGVTGIKLEKEYNTLNDESLLETCDIINDNVQYLSKTIDDFRDFIKGNKNRTYFNLSDTIKALLRILKGAIKNKHIDVEISLDDDININGYENQLLQCLINIFNNSKDALDEKKEKYIFIETFQKENNAIISLTDNAGGIKNEVLPHVFEPYFTTKHKSQGTGLGLHMTHNLVVNAMQGEIKAENKTFIKENISYTGVQMQIILPLEFKIKI